MEERQRRTGEKGVGSPLARASRILSTELMALLNEIASSFVEKLKPKTI